MTARADEIVDAAERIVRGRYAPVQNQSTAPYDWEPLYRYVKGFIIGCAAGLMVGFVLGAVFPPNRDTCRLRANATQVSICLDSPLAKARELGMNR
jgi:hypothetical protein